MQIDSALVDKLATLSRLNFDNTQKETGRQDLEKVLGFFEKISELDTENIEPLIYVNEDEHNVFRADTVQILTTKEEALKNAALKDEDYFLVPKVIKK